MAHLQSYIFVCRVNHTIENENVLCDVVLEWMNYNKGNRNDFLNRMSDINI